MSIKLTCGEGGGEGGLSDWLVGRGGEKILYGKIKDCKRSLTNNTRLQSNLSLRKPV